MWYGSDSNTSSWPPNTSGTRFYIGQLGYIGSKTTNYFLTNMASTAIQSGGFVQGYWFLGSKTSSSYTDYSWGQYMAQLAISQANSYKGDYIGLIWADVESGSSYWTGTTAENYATVSGFCAELQANGFTPGIYSAPSAWSGICGSNSASSIAPRYCWTSEPQESSPPTSMANASPFSDYTISDIVLWQYVSGGADYDAYID